jgi:rhodanese-related sulfurtransferase
MKYLMIILALSLMLSACGSVERGGDAAGEQAQPGAAIAGETVQVEGGSFTRINPEQMAEMLKAKEFFFVNTHIPYEGEIEQTDAFIPYNETSQRLTEYPAEKDAQIVLYCRSGRMSTITAEELVKAGYTNVWELDGGMVAWDNAGYELLQQPE